MRITLNNCTHCGIEYRYQSSGHGCGEQKCSKKYCDDCNTAIHKTLASIPVRRKLIYIPVTEEYELSFDELTDEIEKELQERSKGPGLSIVRVFPCMFKRDTMESSTDGRIKINDVHYHYHFYKSENKISELKIQCMLNCETNTLTLPKGEKVDYDGDIHGTYFERIR